MGEVRTFESRFEWWRPEGFGNWRDSVSLAQGGGILHDLGAHLIDQAVQLFGPVEKSYGETANRGPIPAPPTRRRSCPCCTSPASAPGCG